ncbi:MAG: DUF501 domain-containing protein [Limnochordaceae bacterium]|nr:DUF501 domain-containing protein [Limnochordaceae bacterium]
MGKIEGAQGGELGELLESATEQRELPVWTTATPQDLAVICQQLGRPVQSVLGVVLRCRWGRPMVIASPPLSVRTRRRPNRLRPDWEPFPNLLWLSCPYLAAAVSRLESEGWIRRWRREVETDPAFAAELSAAHQEYARWRWWAVEQVQRQDEEVRRCLAAHPEAEQVLRETGVGGSRDWQAVKCLHAHLAHYLAGGCNPVGRRVAGLLREGGVDVAGDPSCSSEKPCII